MIVISGALVLVALVLLVLGLTMTDLSFVYGSIAVSLISFVFLVIGILQRRGEQPAAATTGGPDVVEDDGAQATAVPATGVAKTGGTGPVPVVETPTADDAYEVDEPAPAGATVLVVPGRPRYHVEGCRYLAGKDVEEVDVESARASYSACGVCKPDAALAEPASAEPADSGVDTVVDSGVPGADEDEELEPVAAPARRSPRRSTGSTAVAAPAATRARKAPARKAAPRTRAVVAEPDPLVADDAVAPEPVAPAAAPARRGKVVVIPERGRFHTADCRFVRDALGTEELTRAQAARQGYQACGVCKP